MFTARWGSRAAGANNSAEHEPATIPKPAHLLLVRRGRFEAMPGDRRRRRCPLYAVTDVGKDSVTDSDKALKLFRMCGQVDVRLDTQHVGDRNVAVDQRMISVEHQNVLLDAAHVVGDQLG